MEILSILETSGGENVFETFMRSQNYLKRGLKIFSPGTSKIRKKSQKVFSSVVPSEVFGEIFHLNGNGETQFGLFEFELISKRWVTLYF